MNLAANASNRGYAMAALLVGMAVMAVLLSVAMPTWNQLIRREKEEELIFRGNQYARAINLYTRSAGITTTAPSIDVLVERRFLRKKFKDPMSTEKSGEFQLLYLSNSAPAGPVSRAGGASQGSGLTGAGQSGANQAGSVGSVLSTTPNGLIAGVASKNTGESLRTYNGKNHYNEWQFVGTQQSGQASVGAGGSGRGGAQGGRQGSVRPDGSFVGRDGRGNLIDERSPGGGRGRQGESGGRGFLPPQGQGQGR